MLVLSGSTIQALSPPEMLHARLSPTLGKYYQPGAWILVHVEVDIPAGHSGVYTPAIHLAPPDSDVPHFVSRLLPMRFEEGRTYHLAFWMIAGDEAPVLWASLNRGQQLGWPLKSAPFENTLTPLPAGQRLILSEDAIGPSQTYKPALLPEDAALYESCDVLALGKLGAKSATAKLTNKQFDAIATWIARDGIVLILRKEFRDHLENAIRRKKFYLGPIFPFLLPPSGHPETRLVSPPARRVGGGLIVDFSAIREDIRIQTVSATWKRIEREYLPAPIADVRLQEQRYRALGSGWPPPPHPTSWSLLRWILTWAVLLLGALILPIHRRQAFYAACTVCLISFVCGVGFLRAHPIQPSRQITTQVRRIGETGAYGPTLDEDIWIVTPFAAPEKMRHQLVIPFHGTLPPRVIFFNHKELRELQVELEQGKETGFLRLGNQRKHAGPIRRGLPILLSRHRTGTPEPAANLVLQEEGEQLGLLVSDSNLPVLFDATLETSATTMRMQHFDGTRLPTSPKTVKEATTPRDRIQRMLFKEHRPGKHATLIGWETATPDSKKDLGTLRIYGLTSVLHTTP